MSASGAEHPELDRLSQAAAETHLDLLVLFGSRARGDAAPGADWDLGYIARSDFDPEELRLAVTEILGTDRVDLVDLNRASGLLRHRAARDGVAVYEARPRAFEDFQVEATLAWCDMEPVLRRAYDEVLSNLDR